MADYVKSTQEQATAAWINHLQQLRFSKCVEKIMQQDTNRENALAELQKLKLIVRELIASNRGGESGLHGFLAEATEVSFTNARNLIKGLGPICDWVNDNGPTDIRYKDGTNIQMKFVQKNFSIGYAGGAKGNASGFYDTYKNNPLLTKEGGKYMPPKDFYYKILKIWNTPIEEASKWTNNDPITFSQWKAIREFFDTTGTTPEDFKPSLLNYADAKRDTIEKTIESEEKKLLETDRKRRQDAYNNSRPSLKEGGTVTAVSAALEGGIAFCSSVAQKRKSGKKLAEFTADDWKEVGIDTGAGTVKGGIRGAAVYALSNFTATPANVATGLVTAVFGVTAQAKLLREGEISEEEFLINSETLCLDVSISTVSALLGQLAIPFPVLGAIVGNVVGMYLYDIAKAQGMEKEQSLIVGYQAEIAALNKKLDEQYKELLTRLEIDLKRFKSMLELAFDSEVNNAFAASIHFALLNGVAEEKILKSKSEIDAFFLA